MEKSLRGQKSLSKVMIDKKWLREGKQSTITPLVKKITSKFKGSDLKKIFHILSWIENNITSEQNHQEVLRIFATRTSDQIVKSKKDTGCHDTAVLLVTFLRAIGIPAKYVLGIDREKPNKGGHTVAEAFVNDNWILIDPSYWRLALKPSRDVFYKENHVICKGLDSWDCGVKTVDDWHKVSERLINKLKSQRSSR
jgi:hypothetical protein